MKTSVDIGKEAVPGFDVDLTRALHLKTHIQFFKFALHLSKTQLAYDLFICKKQHESTLNIEEVDFRTIVSNATSTLMSMTQAV